MPMDHPTKTISYGEMTAKVDEMIAPLILNLWKLDILTFMSCQDNNPKGWIWIDFAAPQDAQRFLSIVANKYSSEPDSLYNRIRQWWDCKGDLWKYDLHPMDLNVDTFEVDPDTVDEKPLEGTKPEFQFTVSVRFPHSDLAEVEANIENYRKGA